MKYSHLKISKDFLEYETKDSIVKIKNTFTVKNFRSQIKNLEYDKFYNAIGGKNARNDNLENFKLPAIVHSYYQLLITQKRIPTVELLCHSYKKKYCKTNKNGLLQLKDEFVEDKNIEFKEEELFGRICRAYNSFHREVDFLLQLIEKYGDKFDFYYSFADDFYKGVDIVCLSKDKKRFDIATYFSSKRSKSYKKTKNTNRHEYKNINIDVIAVFDGKDKNVVRVGDAKLYNEKAVEYVYQELIKERD